MPKIKPTKNTLLCLIAASVLMLGACGFGYYHFSCKLGKLNAQIAKKQKDLDNSEQISRRLTAVEQEYTDAQVKLGTLEKGVSTKSYVPTLLRQLEELGRSVDMKVVGVRPKPVIEERKPEPATTEDKDKGKDKDGKATVAKKAPEPYDKLEIDIEVTGNYSDVTRLLYKITSFPKIVSVNTVQMAPKGGSAFDGFASPPLSVKLGTTAFILKETIPAAKPKTNDQQTANAGSGRS